MTEKRFIELGSTHIKDTFTGNEFYAPCEYELLDLLNQLNDEKEQLSMRYNGLGLEYEGLQEENKQLKRELRECEFYFVSVLKKEIKH